MCWLAVRSSPTAMPGASSWQAEFNTIFPGCLPTNLHLVCSLALHERNNRWVFYLGEERRLKPLYRLRSSGISDPGTLARKPGIRVAAVSALEKRLQLKLDALPERQISQRSALSLHIQYSSLKCPPGCGYPSGRWPMRLLGHLQVPSHFTA